MNRWRYSIAALASLAIFGCRQTSQEAKDQQPTVAATPEKPQLPIAEPPLDREALIFATIRAASAAAAGRGDGESQRSLEGKRFELRMRFGCGGEGADPAEARGWTLDAKRRVLRFKIRPDISATTPLLSALRLGEFEAAQGFWIRRPWLLAAACPVSLPSPQAPSPASSRAPSPKAPSPAETAAPPSLPDVRLGIVQFFTATDARTHRHGNRPYEATQTLEAGAAPGPEGFDLVLAGRLKQVAGGSVIACTTGTALEPPSCIISAEFDRVAIVAAGNGEVVAEWAGG